MAHKGIIIPELSSKDLERFWAKVDKNGPIPPHRPELGPCWLWVGSKTIGRYGNFKIKKRPYGAHRVSFFIHRGRNPEPGMVIMHLCDNMQCVRADGHLEENTHLNNVRDAVQKGRLQSGDIHFSRRNNEIVARGERHANARITDAIVIEARQRYMQDRTLSTIKLAKEYNVCEETMRRAIMGIGWKHIPGLPESYPPRIRGNRVYITKNSPVSLTVPGSSDSLTVQ